MPSPVEETVGVEDGNRAVAGFAQWCGRRARRLRSRPVGEMETYRRAAIWGAGRDLSSGTESGARPVDTIRQTNDSQGGCRRLTGRKGDGISAVGRRAAVADASAVVAMPRLRRPTGMAAGAPGVRPDNGGRGGRHATQSTPTGRRHHSRAESHPRDAAAWVLAKRP